MFEFSRFYPSDYEHGRDFVADLDKFFGNLPKGWPYAVEMRNKHWLAPEYFACLAHHGITHVFNSWDAMPPGERANDASRKPNQSETRCGSIPPDTRPQIRGRRERLQALRPCEGSEP